MTSPRASTWVLALTASAQFVLQLDFAIVNVALATVQRELGFSAVGLQWVVTGYALTFGALLLVGGRIGDLVGHRRTLVLGLVVFALTSLSGGLAQTPWVLVTSRMLQGASAALVAPAALALLTHAFSEPAQRAHALGVFQAGTAAGGTAGIVLGGILTEYAGWRWVLLVNPPVIAVLLALILWRLPASTPTHDGPTRLDLPGASAVTAAIAALIYGVSRGEQHGFGSAGSWVSLVASAALFVTFVAVERRSSAPMLPGSLIADRARGGAVAIVVLLGAVFAGYVYFIALYLQGELGFSAIRTGLALVPATLTALLMSTVLARRFLPTIGPARLLTIALVLVGIGQLWLTRISADGTYVVDVLPGIVLTAAGLGLAMPAASFAITADVPPHQRGVAGGLFVTALQAGSAVGLAMLATVAAARSDHTGSVIDGYHLSYALGTALMVGGLGIAWLSRARAAAPEPAPTAD